MADFSPPTTGTPPRGEPRSALALPSAWEARGQFAAWARDRRYAVFLDYDGTLTPIVERPEDAVMAEAMRDVVQRLARQCPVAIVSGRDRADVERLVGLGELYYAGSHGFDIAGPPGTAVAAQQGEAYLPALDEAERLLTERLAAVPGAQVERKRYSVAIHYRRVPEARVAEVEQAVADAAAHSDRLRRAGGKKVHELQPALDWDKGRAVLHVLAALRLEGADVLPVYIGDDLTDEDAFRALRGRGVGIVVTDEDRPSAADYRLADVAQVRAFLAHLVATLAGLGRA